jgi:hypothetical protein
MNYILQAISKHKIVSIFVVFLLVLIFQDDVKVYTQLFLERSVLPHYRSAIKIDKDTFQKIESDFSFNFSFEGNTIYDKREDTYYMTPDFYSYDAGSNMPILKFEHSTSTEGEVFDVRVDERFQTTGGLACFSCGCSCYVDRSVVVAGGENYFMSSGENYAMSPERQGLYYQNDDGTWTKLTPKLGIGGRGFNSMEREIQDKLKIFNNGCSVAYAQKDEYYQLNVCSKPDEPIEVKEEPKKPVVVADEYDIEILGVDTTKAYKPGSIITVSWKWSGSIPGVDTWVGFSLVNEVTKREAFLTDAIFVETGTVDLEIPIQYELPHPFYSRSEALPLGKYRLKAFIYGTDDRVYPSALSGTFNIVSDVAE